MEKVCRFLKNQNWNYKLWDVWLAQSVKHVTLDIGGRVYPKKKKKKKKEGRKERQKERKGGRKKENRTTL